MAHSGPWDPFLFVTTELTDLPKIYGMTGTITSITKIAVKRVSPSNLLQL